MTGMLVKWTPPRNIYENALTLWLNAHWPKRGAARLTCRNGRRATAKSHWSHGIRK
jgi:hypothetical protein